MANDKSCPCGSDNAYKQCCHMIHVDHSVARTPEQLMRARYSAYVFNHLQFIRASWDSSTLPLAIESDHKPRWLFLEVLNAGTAVNTVDPSGFVHYRAHYVENNQLCALTEMAHFILKQGLWYYLSGEVHHSRIPISGKTKCPCGSGKKFKRCCATR